MKDHLKGKRKRKRFNSILFVIGAGPAILRFFGIAGSQAPITIGNENKTHLEHGLTMINPTFQIKLPKSDDEGSSEGEEVKKEIQ